MLSQGEVIAVMSLLTGMIGGTILVLPLQGLSTGYFLIPLITILFGILSGYTTYLLALHLGQCKTMREAILEHFNGQRGYLILYNIIIIMSFLGLLINYFQLVVVQVESLIADSPWISVGCIVFMFFLTLLMRKINAGDKLLAFGLFSIIAYLCFLAWVLASKPEGEKVLRPIQPGFLDLATSLVMGYAVQNFSNQILVKNTSPASYKKVILIMTIFGIFAYGFFSFSCFGTLFSSIKGILNRESLIPSPETIEDYFSSESWQVKLIQISYLLNLLSTAPEFCILMKTAFLDNFGIEQKQQIQFSEILTFLGIFGFIFLIYATGVKISIIIEINGSCIGLLYVFLFPIFMHLRFVYFNKKDDEGRLIYEVFNEKGELVRKEGNCKCKVNYSSDFEKYAETSFLIFIILLSSSLTFISMYNLFNQPQAPIEDL